MPKFSVIIPVYNAEKWLRQCIDSVLAQTFTDFELLLIDDGSTDASGAICDEYARKCLNISVLHKQNGGVSSARNLGLDNAKGEFIAFIDADDYVDPDYLETLLPRSGEDLVCCSYAGYRGGQRAYEVLVEERELMSAKELLSHTCAASLSSLCCKALRLSIIQANGLRLNESLSISEDLEFMLRYLLCGIETVTTRSRCPYSYERGTDETLCSRRIIPLNELHLFLRLLGEHIVRLREAYSWHDNECLFRAAVATAYTMAIHSIKNSLKSTKWKANEMLRLLRNRQVHDVIMDGGILLDKFGRVGGVLAKYAMKACYIFIPPEREALPTRGHSWL